MPETKKEFLIQEAKTQAEALRRLGVWKRAALSLMVIGGLSAYSGFVTDPNLVRGVFGILGASVSGMAAFLITVGRGRGKKNVDNILKAAAEL